MRLLERSYDMLVMVCGIVLYGIALIPGYYLIYWGHGLGFPWAVFTWPAAFYLFIFSLVLLVGGIKTLCLPRLKPGTYKFGRDSHIFVWFVSRSLTEFVLTPFNRIIFTNDVLRFLCLKLFGARIAYSSGISSSFLSDFDLLTFGKNCMVGGWAVIYGHVEPEPGTLILGSVSIGDHTMIGARSNIGCGTQVGHHTVIGFGCVLSVNIRIGDHCHVGFSSNIGHHVLIEDQVKIGKGCHIGNGAKVRQGITVHDFSMIPDMTTLTSQAMADRFRPARLSDVSSPAVQSAQPRQPAEPALNPKRPRIVIRQSPISSSSR